MGNKQQLKILQIKNPMCALLFTEENAQLSSH